MQVGQYPGQAHLASRTEPTLNPDQFLGERRLWVGRRFCLIQHPHEIYKLLNYNVLYKNLSVFRDVGKSFGLHAYDHFDQMQS